MFSGQKYRKPEMLVDFTEETHHSGTEPVSQETVLLAAAELPGHKAS